jgi:hypothetical protein
MRGRGAMENPIHGTIDHAGLVVPNIKRSGNVLDPGVGV